MHHEGWDTMLEAAVFATLALAVDTPGIRDTVIDGVTGRLAHESILPEKFGRAMVSFLSEHDRRTALGIAAGERALEFSRERSIGRGEQVLL